MIKRMIVIVCLLLVGFALFSPACIAADSGGVGGTISQNDSQRIASSSGGAGGVPGSSADDSKDARGTDTFDLKFHLIISAINFAIIFLLTILFLYPFHLRDKKPARYRGIWAAIGGFFGNRYSALWLLNMFTGLFIFNFVAVFAEGFIPRMAAMLVFFVIILPIYQWYPFYLKEKKPAKYRGIWKRIGDWLGEPRLSMTAPGS